MPIRPRRRDPPVFHVVLIKPTHYDDDGYPIRWVKAAIPSNTLASLNSLAEDAVRRQVLGPDVTIRLHTFDETNQRLYPVRLIRIVHKTGGRALFDRMFRLRQNDGIRLNLMIQVDTLCHRIPNFIEKAALAGVRRVFIGLENINPDNLIATKKHQNKITEYRVMLQKWREHGMITYAGYITGFPDDTKQSILRDIEIIKRELPLDLLELFYLTPLPGSEDHRTLWQDGVWMDSDLNKYDLSHRVTHHPRISDTDWEETYRAAWESFYSFGHMRTILRRAAANPNGRPRTILTALLWFKLATMFEGVHPLEGGTIRRKARRERRPGLPRLTPMEFYPRAAAEITGKAWNYWSVFRRTQQILKETLAAPDRGAYSDLSISPPEADEFDHLDLYRLTNGGEGARARKRRDDMLRAKVG